MAISKAKQAELVDDLGVAKAKAAAFEEASEALRDKVAAFGHGDYDGKRYRATVREGVKQTIPQVKLLAKLTKLMGAKAALRWIRANTEETPTVTVKVVARVVSAAVARRSRAR